MTPEFEQGGTILCDVFRWYMPDIQGKTLWAPQKKRAVFSFRSGQTSSFHAFRWNNKTINEQCMFCDSLKRLLCNWSDSTASPDESRWCCPLLSEQKNGSSKHFSISSHNQFKRPTHAHLISVELALPWWLFFSHTFWRLEKLIGFFPRSKRLEHCSVPLQD